MPSIPRSGIDGQIDEGLFMFAVFVRMLYVEGVYMVLREIIFEIYKINI